MTESRDVPWQIALANDVSDGKPVDWEDVAVQPGDANAQRIVEGLRRVAAVVEAHKTFVGDVPTQTATAEATASRIWRHLVLLEVVGKGAFGTVYRAWDPQLDREVALKLLEGTSLRSPLAEARHLARVRHPNVVAVYGAEQIDQQVGIWMEFIEGETLATFVRDRGPMSPREVAGVAIDLCRAVAALHRAGLLHGDIKANNAMREIGGRIVLMDFSGARPPHRDDSAALSGTPLYIAPEVFEGHLPSFAAEVYSLGVLLFYLLSGRFPVEGAELDEIRRRHRRGERLQLRHLRPELPDSIIHVIERAIAADPTRRFQTVGELEDSLASIFSVHAPASSSDAHLKGNRTVSWQYWLLATMLATIVTLGTVATIERSRPVPTLPQAPIQFTIGPPYNTGSWPRISPDGRLVVFGTIVEGRTLLWVRPLDTMQGRALAGTETVETPFWSADSRHLAFIGSGALKTVDVSDGRIETVTAAAALHGGDWSLGGVILFADTDGIARVSADGSDRRQLTTVNRAEGEYQHGWPEFLPDGKRFLYIVRSYRTENAGLYLGSIDSTVRQRIMPAYSRVAYAESGHLLFVRDGTLMARSFDPSSRQLSDDTTPLVGPIKFHPASDAAFDISRSGILIYRLNEGLSSTRLKLFDRRGREIRALTPVGFFRQPRFSPDGTRVATEQAQTDSPDPDIWLLQSTHEGAARFTNDAGPDVRPVWSPDGRRLAFSSKRGSAYDIYVKSVDARDDEELIWRSDADKLVEDWSPDGRTLAVNVLRSGLWLFPLDRTRKPSLIHASASSQPWQSEFSRDGRWLAYAGADSEPSEVFVEPTPGTGARWQVSANGGAEPHWRGDGRELLYLSLDGWITSVDVPAGSTWKPGAPRRLFRVSVPEIRGTTDFTVTHDGELLGVNTLEGDPSVPPIHVVVNWERMIRR
jgi:serine/threonine protein kinase